MGNLSSYRGWNRLYSDSLCCCEPPYKSVLGSLLQVLGLLDIHTITFATSRFMPSSCRRNGHSDTSDTCDTFVLASVSRNPSYVFLLPHGRPESAARNSLAPVGADYTLDLRLVGLRLRFFCAGGDGANPDAVWASHTS